MRKGFTLVELSIVLVIIGLLIGGILVAQSMIGTVKTQRIIKDIGQMEIAVTNFKTNYKSWPGDSPLLTPPGNGNNVLNFSALCSGAYSLNENAQVFAHLSQAKMFDKNYGTYSPTDCVTGTHDPDYLALPNAVLWPFFTDLDERAQVVDYYTKMPFYSQKGADYMNFNFRLWLNTKLVVPIEQKLGPNTSDGTYRTPGLVNGTSQLHGCYDDLVNIVDCSASSAHSGMLTYVMQPL